MAGNTDDDSDIEWTGRPQDDPRYIAVAAAARQAYRVQHPPVNCWIDSVQEIDLYLSGKHRARVLTDKATVHLFDDNGNVTASLIYLRSETPFDAVERHLGIGRVAEVRDDSNEGGGEISARPRNMAERSARAFRQECPEAAEAGHYLREAIHTYEFLGGPVIRAGLEWRSMIETAVDALAQNDREAARRILLEALTGMNRNAVLDWQMAWVDCARAAEVLRRDLAAEAART